LNEAIRLVIWDLDGTFWGGTLTEGGHTYSDANHNIVVELAKRGIVSSICSKNDFETVRELLVSSGIWDYFVFPSIDWTPKGPRLKQLIEAIQLRPETVLFLDDNPLNLNEAKFFVPEVQTADHSVIPQLLDAPLLAGKADPELTRLKQYRLLESKKSDQAVAADNLEFLRSCEIKVSIEPNVEKHLDRAIELINRTNQLNFTKKRLPEDMAAARETLLEQLGEFDAQAGLIRVTDRYGDYGYCGFYLVRTRRGQSRLEHFCFSCRILHMGVENWIYQRLGSPSIEVSGEVLSDLSSDAAIDWISLLDGGETHETHKAAAPLPRVFIRGACLVSPLAHYFQMSAKEVIGEFNLVRRALSIRLDHSLMLRYAIEGVDDERMQIFEGLGFVPDDFQTAFVDHPEEPCIRLLSTWVDVQGIVYRHKQSGTLVPYKVKRMSKKGVDVLGGEEDLQNHLEELPRRAADSVRYLRDNFEFIGILPEKDADEAWDVILDAVPEGQPIFLALASEGGGPDGRPKAAEFNERLQRAVKRHSRKTVVPIAFADLASDLISDEQRGSNHFHRNVYYRVYQELRACWNSTTGSADTKPRCDASSPSSAPVSVAAV
jgi:FkbH-like protein